MNEGCNQWQSMSTLPFCHNYMQVIVGGKVSRVLQAVCINPVGLGGGLWLRRVLTVCCLLSVQMFQECYSEVVSRVNRTNHLHTLISSNFFFTYMGKRRFCTLLVVGTPLSMTPLDSAPPRGVCDKMGGSSYHHFFPGCPPLAFVIFF